MKKFAKVMAVMLCAVLLVCGSVFGTLAYLTSKTDVITNTFTFGGVIITMDEAKVNENGEADTSAQRVIENTFKLMPGKSYDKDPTIHINPISEECYLYVKVVNGIAELEEALDNSKPTIQQQMEQYGWKEVAGQGNIYMYVSTGTAKVDTGVAVKPTDTNCGKAGDFRVFEKLHIAPSITGFTEFNGATIKITGYAIQKEGFSDGVDAWNKAHSSFVS